jgi:hypothetical protein
MKLNPGQAKIPVKGDFPRMYVTRPTSMKAGWRLRPEEAEKGGGGGDYRPLQPGEESLSGVCQNSSVGDV